MYDVAVVTGTGGMGLAIARRLGSGRTLALADYDPDRLARATEALEAEGLVVDPSVLDVGDRSSVAAFAQRSGSLGRVVAIAHTAGVSSTMADSRNIYRIDLLGTAYVIEEFLAVAGPGTALTCIASMAAFRERVPLEIEEHLGRASTDQLLALPELDVDGPDTRRAYHLAKRGVQIRVQTAAPVWGEVGARINSLSPGIILTPMVTRELGGAGGDGMRTSLANTPVRRMGTPEDIAAAVAFLSSSAASFITGIDLLVDGGANAVRRWRS